jgi:hypothetical protein
MHKIDRFILAPAVEQNHYGAIGLPFRQPTDRAREHEHDDEHEHESLNFGIWGQKRPPLKLGLHPFGFWLRSTRKDSIAPNQFTSGLKAALADHVRGEFPEKSLDEV